MSLALSLVFWAFSVILAVQLPNYHYNTYIAPLVIVIPLFIMSSFQVARDIIKLVKKRKTAGRPEDADGAGAAEAGRVADGAEADGVAEGAEAGRVAAEGGTAREKVPVIRKLLSIREPVGVFVWIILAVVCCYIFSILIAAFVFIGLYLALVAKSKWYFSILASLVTCSILYFAFGYFLKVDFFRDALLFVMLRR